MKKWLLTHEWLPGILFPGEIDSPGGIILFASGGGRPLYPDIYTLFHNDPAAPQDYCCTDENE